jgi:hypothetical protein
MKIRCEFVHIVLNNGLLWNLIRLLGYNVNILSAGNDCFKMAYLLLGIDKNISLYRNFDVYICRFY